ncbi:MAG: hypothetical protein K2M17_00805 [Bacilli bacterium]|nr:hypothetical protein [Bacilli bacterium]
MLFKSYYKRKRTLFGGIILIFFGLIFLMLIALKEYYFYKFNTFGYYYELLVDKDYKELQEKIKSVENVSYVSLGTSAIFEKADEWNLFESYDPDLKLDELIISTRYQSKELLEKIGKKVVITLNNKDYTFTLKKVNYENNALWINPSIFAEMTSEVTKFALRIKLNDWSINWRNYTKNKIYDLMTGRPVFIYDIVPIRQYPSNYSQEEANSLPTFHIPNYEIILFSLGVVIKIFIIILIIVFFCVASSVLSYEKRYDDLYYRLGFSRKQILIKNFINVFSLMFISIIILLLIYFILKKYFWTNFLL